MNQVTVQEIVDALNLVGYAVDAHCNATSAELVRQRVANRIKAHGIAPPDGMVLVSVKSIDAILTAAVDMYAAVVASPKPENTDEQ